MAKLEIRSNFISSFFMFLRIFFLEKKSVINFIPLYSFLNFFAEGSMPYKLQFLPNNFKKEASLLPISSKLLPFFIILYFFNLLTFSFK